MKLNLRPKEARYLNEAIYQIIVALDSGRDADAHDGLAKIHEELGVARYGREARR